MEASFIPQSNHGIMDDEEEEDVGSMSSFTEEEDEGSSNSMDSSSSDLVEDATSSSASSSNGHLGDQGPLFEMSSLISHLPFKRGLSKHFEGKSQSFTSLSNVRSLEDLVKPERPFRKKLKSSKSYGWGLDSHKALSPKSCSRTITKKSSKGSFSSLSTAKRHSFLGSRPPIPPQRSSGSISGHTLLFA